MCLCATIESDSSLCMKELKIEFFRGNNKEIDRFENEIAKLWKFSITSVSLTFKTFRCVSSNAALVPMKNKYASNFLSHRFVA
jgi:hypothetical protein